MELIISRAVMSSFGKLNILIKITETRVFVVYPMWVYQNRYDQLADQFCLRANWLDPCYA